MQSKTTIRLYFLFLNFTLLLGYTSQAQREGNIWLLSQHTVLDFNYNPARVYKLEHKLSIPPPNTENGLYTNLSLSQPGAVISDCNGNLELYSWGDTIYDDTGLMIEGGAIAHPTLPFNLGNGEPVFIRNPGVKNSVLLFIKNYDTYIDCRRKIDNACMKNSINCPFYCNGIEMYRIDKMSGAWKVLKRTLLNNDYIFFLNFSPSPHQNKNNYWATSIYHPSENLYYKFLSYLMDSSGIYKTPYKITDIPVDIEIDQTLTNSYLSQPVFSLSNRFLLNTYTFINNSGIGFIQTYDFDNSSGAIETHKQLIPDSTQFGTHTSDPYNPHSFSHDGNYLYYTSGLQRISVKDTRDTLWVADISSAKTENLRTISKVLYTRKRDPNIKLVTGQIKAFYKPYTGPDGNIYLGILGTDTLLRFKQINGLTHSKEAISLNGNIIDHYFPTVNYSRPVYNISGKSTVCAGATGLQYSALPYQGCTYQWIVKGGALVQGQGTTNATINWGLPDDNALIKLAVTYDSLCSDTVFFPVNLTTKLPVDTIVGPDTLCFNEAQNIIYQTTPIDNAQITWEIDGGTGSPVKNALNKLNATWTVTGMNAIYITQTIVNSIATCIGSDTSKVWVAPFPDSNLQINGPSEYCQYSDPAKFNIQGSLNSTYKWDVQGGSVLSGQGKSNIEASWNFTGQFPISVIEINKLGCVGPAIIKEVTVKSINECLDFCNVITPNGDHVNDYFIIKNIENYENSRLDIYNRWGVKVFTSSNYKNEFPTETIADGIYYYSFQQTYDYGQNTVEKNGWLQVIK